MIDAALNTADDPRWLELNHVGLACACGQRHLGLFPIHMLAPVGWTGAREYKADEALNLDADFLSENYCVWRGQHFAVRMRLPIQIRDAAPAALVFTVWASLTRPEIEAYAASRSIHGARSTAHLNARLLSRIAGYAETSNLSGIALQQADGTLPLLLVTGPQPGANPSHALITDQGNGIGLDRALEIYAAYGHDMRGHLSATTH